MKIKKWMMLFILTPCLAHAEIPVGSIFCYGAVKDSMGSIYQDGAHVALIKADGTVAAEQEVDGLLYPGINFKLPLSLDNGRGDLFASYAVCAGEVLEVEVTVGGQTVAFMGAQTISMPEDLTNIHMTLTAGSTDSDGDGLPDTWEQELLDYAEALELNNGIGSIDQIRPGDDFDGDGVSNYNEYLAGTFAFLANDVFSIRELSISDEGIARIVFPTVSGKMYQLEAKADLSDAAISWDPVSFSTSEAGAADEIRVLGDGEVKTLYVEVTDSCKCFQLHAQ
ncbi:hypothetical protein P4E94_09460 [Pontiellaceae bacterium B12219]|nr:hypothetical protein [Pontiellaceae bacterium B12219]